MESLVRSVSAVFKASACNLSTILAIMAYVPNIRLVLKINVFRLKTFPREVSMKRGIWKN